MTCRSNCFAIGAKPDAHNIVAVPLKRFQKLSLKVPQFDSTIVMKRCDRVLYHFSKDPIEIEDDKTL